jgi:hypothetical protein
MSTKYKGVNATVALQTPPTIFEYIEGGQYQAYSQFIWDTFVLTADLASGDTILMGGLSPQNSTIVACDLGFGAMGGSCTVNVGWQASADAVVAANATGLFSAASCASAGLLGLGSSGGQVTAFGKLLASPVQFVIAENAVSSGGTASAFWLKVTYFTS